MGLQAKYKIIWKNEKKMEFFIFNRIFGIETKNICFIRNCVTKIVGLFKTNNFAFLHFFVFHILLLKKN